MGTDFTGSDLFQTVGGKGKTVTAGTKRSSSQALSPQVEHQVGEFSLAHDHPEGPCSRKIPKVIFMSGPSTWRKLDSCVIHATSFDGDHPLTENLLRAHYCETDIYMFSVAKLLQREGYKCAIMSKDSDVLGTFCMTEPVKSNPLTVLYQTNQFTFAKDLDFFFQHKIESSLKPMDLGDRMSAREIADTYFGGDMVNMLLDTTDTHLFPALREAAASFEAYLKHNKFTDSEVSAVYVYMAEIGLRGPLFRRYVTRCHVDRRCGSGPAAIIRNLVFTSAPAEGHNYTIKMISKPLAAKFFAESFTGFSVETLKTSRTTVDQDGFSVVTEANFRTQPHAIIKRYTEREMAADNSLLFQRVNMMRTYAAGLLKPNTYGEYLMFNMRNVGNMVRLQHNTGLPQIRAQSAGLMAIMSGTDYNFLISKIGRTHIMNVWVSPEWEAMAAALINKATAQLKDNLPKETGSSWAREYVRLAKLTKKAEELLTNEMLWCVERTAAFVVDLWRGRQLSGFEFYCMREANDGLEFDLTTEELNSLDSQM